ncbi:AraC family transcriptional regulator [Puteibacter caeruleilacunae]|nr:AraC family transcriptional regulator [Puteibacter caeruleilacunae]
MKQNFKYLTHSEDDEKWGLYLNVAGHAEIAANEYYPPKGHPDEYNFDWNKGRILDEYQLLYIVSGTGIFETRDQKVEVKEGNVIFLYPFQWHRYRPTEETGWTEHYIGFNGSIANQVMEFFSESPVQYIGFNEEIYQNYRRIFQLVNDETRGYQQAASGNVLQILGKIRQIILNQSYANDPMEKLINQARLYMRAHMNEQFNLEDLANDLNIGYSLFRGEFKKYTGMSPGQYLLQLKIQMAKNLLSNSDKSVKEISHQIGFESPYYFSRIFKKHVDMSPSEFREMSEKGNK